jgi:tetratricopeptide (TPR) repeat protein
METVFQNALALQRAGRLDEAEALYRQVLGWRPAWSAGNLGMLLRTTGRLEEAEAMLRTALAAEPDHLAVQHSLGMTLLQRGQYAEGWFHYESRFALRNWPSPPFPRWEGQSLKGKRILVVGEQGFGDQIMLSRFVPLVAQQAGEVVFAPHRLLASLMTPMHGVLLEPRDWASVEVDYWTALASAPRWLGAGPADAPAPNLPLPAAAQPPRGTGLMLRGGPTNANPRRVPGPAVAQAIRGLADFIDLDPEVTGARDFAETAAIIARLERVVSVDTATAHLAGALGKPCWILLPRPAGDWYTNWHDDRTPWYGSARTIRQSRPGDWTGVLVGLDRVLHG